ncbi:MAG: hypothetical protein GXO64_01815 [Candidatus Micrarchaeota archaeon]|nr:hypothetical protein [Candidatus Micrarchaeota archaeon]
MASFARTKMTFQDDCFPDKPEVPSIKLVGPNTPKLYQMIYDTMKNVFHVLDHEIEEENFSWGKMGDKEKFTVRWYVHKDKDYFSFFYLRVDLSGSGNENTGQATIKIKPVLRTSFPQDTLWQRSLLYEIIRTFWHRAFYHKKRVGYLIDCRNITTAFIKEVVKKFREMNENIKPSAAAGTTVVRRAQPAPRPDANQNRPAQPAVHRPPPQRSQK